MIFRKMHAPYFPNKWETKAQKALEEVSAIEDAAKRSETITKKKSVWGDYKWYMAASSYGKCWYCETNHTFADLTVDHYRPKNQVKDVDEHDGYWWLAFDWHNFRLACPTCNFRRTNTATGEVEGKGSYFPLLNPEGRCIDADASTSQEQPILIDPCVRADVTLISFDQTGRAIEACSSDNDAAAYKRAHESIYYYHLNHTNTVEKRAQTWTLVDRRVKDLKFLFSLDISDDEFEQRFEDTMEELVDLVSSYSEYTRTARIALLHSMKEEADECFRSWFCAVFELAV